MVFTDVSSMEVDGAGRVARYGVYANPHVSTAAHVQVTSCCACVAHAWPCGATYPRHRPTSAVPPPPPPEPRPITPAFPEAAVPAVPDPVAVDAATSLLLELCIHRVDLSVSVPYPVLKIGAVLIPWPQLPCSTTPASGGPLSQLTPAPNFLLGCPIAPCRNTSRAVGLTSFSLLRSRVIDALLDF